MSISINNEISKLNNLNSLNSFSNLNEQKDYQKYEDTNEQTTEQKDDQQEEQKDKLYVIHNFDIKYFYIFYNLIEILCWNIDLFETKALRI